MLQNALKEWAIAVDALIAGQTVLLLRKGGIREIGKHFQVPHQHVWLYPTYEHQKPHLLKPKWARQVTPVKTGWHPPHSTIQAWADVAHVWTVRNQQAVESLLPFHIWNEQFVTERFRWKPNQPLNLLLLRVHQLTTPVHIDWHPNYGGCRSWLALENPLDTQPSTPVLNDLEWITTVETIHSHINSIEPVGPLARQ